MTEGREELARILDDSDPEGGVLAVVSKMILTIDASAEETPTA